MKTKVFLLSSLLFIGTILSAQEETPSLPQDQSETAPSVSQSSEETAPSLTGAEAGSKAQADSAYMRENYELAAVLYRQLAQRDGESAELYFNLGNCYYRQDSIAKAILYYERARLLDPSDDDIRFNLEMARVKTVDKVVPASEMFFVTLFRSLVLSLSISGWAILGISLFVLMLIALALYLFVPHLLTKKISFAVAVVALLVCIFANIAAVQQRKQIDNRTGAVIMSASAVVKSTPSTSGADLFILHEGTHVEIVDDTMREWVEVRMSDGKEGWLHRSEIEII